MFKISPLLSRSYSLFIVRSTSLICAFNNYKKGAVSIQTGLLFGASSIAMMFHTRKFLNPLISRQLFKIEDFKITEPIVTVVLFALLMMAASFGMIKCDAQKTQSPECNRGIYFKPFVFAIGLTRDLLGVGGSFLLIPTPTFENVYEKYCLYHAFDYRFKFFNRIYRRYRTF